MTRRAMGVCIYQSVANFIQQGICPSSYFRERVKNHSKWSGIDETDPE